MSISLSKRVINEIDYDVQNNIIIPIENMGYRFLNKGIILRIKFDEPQIDRLSFPTYILNLDSVKVLKKFTYTIGGSPIVNYILSFAQAGQLFKISFNDRGIIQYEIMSDNKSTEIYITDEFMSIVQNNHDENVRDRKTCSRNAKIYKAIRLLLESIVDSHREQASNGKTWESFIDRTLIGL